ncbi:hypothetical protein N0V83_006578 [Neocucurbitaria cava]|uniref:Uncharacterized protein n=1 Tax=Neocucurbitaria cava TaxID=798079 RepID=A0A9W9CL91_9PLEO|nr:hypothetical protein N0V83_006578 [Neocucurbitaria cava]
MSRSNQWWIPGEGIAREVITEDIQRYLGPDALVRPGTGTGEYEGQNGYWITAYRTLTSQMIQDLKMDSQRWQMENTGSRSSYQDSRTHAARQHWGPSSVTTVSGPAQNPYNQSSSISQLAGPPPADPYRNPYTVPAYEPYPPYATYSQSGYPVTIRKK